MLIYEQASCARQIIKVVLCPVCVIYEGSVLPKKLLDNQSLPTLVSERLNVWGRCIRTQRLRQRIQAADLCGRMDISLATLRRLERGDPGAGIGIYLTALMILGLIDKAAPALDPTLWLDAGGSRVRRTQHEGISTNVDYFQTFVCPSPAPRYGRLGDGGALPGRPQGTGQFHVCPELCGCWSCLGNRPLEPALPAGRRDRSATLWGLRDVLRDACPDGWGQALLRREHNLPHDTSMARYLVLASNADRWGALAVGTRPKPSVAALATPKLPQLQQVVEELAALNAQQPPVHARLRRRLVETAGVGGARPKATLQDGEGAYWLVKPGLASDVADIPRLEHFARQWGTASGLRFAPTVLHPAAQGSGERSAVRVLRFDRERDRRALCVSAASLLQTEYPGGFANTARWSYPRLAEELRWIGAPVEDRHELFGRMIFNAVCGNDDDQPRNHAIVFQAEGGSWRLHSMWCRIRSKRRLT